MFVPQSYALGQEAQVDWFEASAKLGGEHCVLQFFAMRSMSSSSLASSILLVPAMTAWNEASRGRCLRARIGLWRKRGDPEI